MSRWRGSAPRLGRLCCHRRCRAATATPSHSPIVHRSVPGRIVILSQPSSTGRFTTSWQVTSKRLAPITLQSCCLVGGRVPHALPGRAWAAAMLESWLQYPQLASKCREVLAQIYQLSTKPGRNDEQVPPTVSGHGWRWGPGSHGRSAGANLLSMLGTARLSPRSCHRSLAAQELVQRSPTATAQGCALCCRHWDELGKGKGRNRTGRAWRAGVGARGAEMCS